MKRTIYSLVTALTLVFNPMTVGLLIPIGIVATAEVGCTTGKGTYNPSTQVYDSAADASVLVVTAEKTGATALDAFDRFMKFERENQEALAKVSPKIHASAEEIRAHGKTWLLDLDAAKVAYQANRGDPHNTTKLQAALAVIQSAVASAISYLATSVK